MRCKWEIDPKRTISNRIDRERPRKIAAYSPERSAGDAEERAFWEHFRFVPHRLNCVVFLDEFPTLAAFVGWVMETPI